MIAIEPEVVMQFADHFSSQAAEYVRFRPAYPPALFAWLAAVAPARALAWDCATGSGQAAGALATHFERVVASDASAAQLAQALPYPQVEYCVAAAESPPPAARGADLVTVAQALHWFDLDRFYPAVRVTLRPGGVVAVWGYGLTRISAEVDAVVSRYYQDVVGPYWPPERRHIENGYRELPFPFAAIEAPRFEMRAEWSLDALLGYLDTWSASRRYLAAHGRHPLAEVAEDLAAAWGAARVQTVTWPLFLRVGRV